MELHEALSQISTIRLQLARTEQFRGYRAAPIALTGVMAIAAGVLQAAVIDEPREQLRAYLALWLSVAGLSLATCLADLWVRHRRSAGLLHREATELALGQFFPCVLAGGLLTVVIARSAPQSAWMLPGLWAILFSLGLFASWRLLPRAIFGVATFYLASGLYVLSLGDGPLALSAWTMPLLFGAGQLVTAAVLLLSERRQTGATP